MWSLSGILNFKLQFFNLFCSVSGSAIGRDPKPHASKIVEEGPGRQAFLDTALFRSNLMFRMRLERVLELTWNAYGTRMERVKNAFQGAFYLLSIYAMCSSTVGNSRI